MHQEKQKEKLKIPSLSRKMFDQINENNLFLDAKNLALLPLSDDLDEIELHDTFHKRINVDKSYYFNSNVIIVSNRTVSESNSPMGKYINSFMNNYNKFYV